ncbi:MAG: flavodoxin family protein [Oscillospiraceae bacterium]|nr:flavodoxin family protein [Oscillospiraceae bacterium]
MKIVAVNGSPRIGWNTSSLVREAAKGAESQGAEVEIFDLYKLDKFTGCVSCFACKLPPNEGKCVCRDGLAPVLASIRNSDGLILGSPNYLGDVSAGFRSLYERLIFQSLTYKNEPRSYNDKKIPVLFIMTSNADKSYYPHIGYDAMLRGYQQTLGTFVGSTKLLIAGNTKQVRDYSRFDWTMFDTAAKDERHEKVFPVELKEAYDTGVKLVREPW